LLLKNGGISYRMLSNFRLLVNTYSNSEFWVDCPANTGNSRKHSLIHLRRPALYSI